MRTDIFGGCLAGSPPTSPVLNSTGAPGTRKKQKIADHFGVCVHTVYSWKGRLQRTGSLRATVARGAASRLTAEQGEQLRSLLREGALEHGFPDETWTTQRVKELIGRRFNLWSHHDQVRYILRGLGLTPQMPGWTGGRTP